MRTYSAWVRVTLADLAVVLVKGESELAKYFAEYRKTYD